jgi:hypothetical protein
MLLLTPGVLVGSSLIPMSLQPQNCDKEAAAAERTTVGQPGTEELGFMQTAQLKLPASSIVGCYIDFAPSAQLLRD